MKTCMRCSEQAMTELIDVAPMTFAMGEEGPLSYPADGEGPVRDVTLSTYSIATTTVSNVEFAHFVEQTGHVTDAERYGWSFVFAGHLPDDFAPTRGVASAPWWRQVEQASWMRPFGPSTSLDGLWDHPVVHVSYNDAKAYAAHLGCRLPSEAEWECAARAGSSQSFPWGDQLLGIDGAHRANVWQGVFPAENTEDDGYYGTAPVRAFEANRWGIHNMIGNVWEWTGDWFGHEHSGCCAPDPSGPVEGEMRVLKGGSYLCHDSYCARFRPAARSASAEDSSAGNVGFRLAR